MMVRETGAPGLGMELPRRGLGTSCPVPAFSNSGSVMYILSYYCRE